MNDILEILMNDARTSPEEIAKMTGQSVAVVKKQIKAYETDGTIVQYKAILNPEMIVIGGGVLKSAPRDYWQEMVQSAKQHAWPEAFRTTRIFRSPLLGCLGDLGALALVFNKNKRP